MGECSQGVALDFSLDWMEADEMAVCPTCTDTSTSVRKNMSSINCSSDWQPQEGRAHAVPALCIRVHIAAAAVSQPASTLFSFLHFISASRNLTVFARRFRISY